MTEYRYSHDGRFVSVRQSYFFSLGRLQTHPAHDFFLPFYLLPSALSIATFVCELLPNVGSIAAFSLDG